MSKRTETDLLDFGKDVKSMSAGNITPPDTASKPQKDDVDPKTGAVDQKETTKEAASRSPVGEPDGKNNS
ncbi:hypothetical protein H072_3746 [Dactylellina haptotyla CBS 200.50]|uniref:Uncharacterized protein n=1 Tax=Dactylellina haptotyla (strain CBS 200.50) TaxID=1284197 RepID=S8AMF1_DACHA|nr:hypothetical protein H072_3746 [Dactylellina haptotyla CBS 200.50]